MSTPFRIMHHVCIVVHDIEKAVEHYSNLGIGPWFDFPDLSVFGDLEMPNREAFLAMTYKCADTGNVQFQLCQPPELDCPQRRFLDERGPGVFHIGFAAEDIDSSERAGQELGLDVVMRGRREDGTGFSYFDTRDSAGVTLMVRSVPPPPRNEV